MMSSTMEKTTEKRKYPRFAVDNEFTLRLLGKDYSGLIGNISQGGAYLKAVKPALAKSLLFQGGEITLNLPNAVILVQCSISFIGTGHSKHATGVGITFTGTDEQAAIELFNYIENIQLSFKV